MVKLRNKNNWITRGQNALDTTLFFGCKGCTAWKYWRLVDIGGLQPPALDGRLDTTQIRFEILLIQYDDWVSMLGNLVFLVQILKVCKIHWGKFLVSIVDSWSSIQRGLRWAPSFRRGRAGRPQRVRAVAIWWPWSPVSSTAVSFLPHISNLPLQWR